MTTSTIIDPVCGMTVVPERAAGHVVHDGQNVYFCSKGCAAKCQQDPAKYLKAPGSSPMASGQAGLVQLGGGRVASSPAAAAYVCPMGLEVRANKAGGCPK